MTWWNPKTWFKKEAAPAPETPEPALATSTAEPPAPPPPPPPPPAVYVRFELDHRFGPITLGEPAAGPWVKLLGLSLEEAAGVLPGQGFKWHTIPMDVRVKFEFPPYTHAMEWGEAKQWIT